MADFYAQQQVGVADATQIPPLKADGRVVGAKKRVILASNPAAQALVANDRMYLGRLRQNEQLIGLVVIADTSLSTTTFSVGTTAAATKYANAKAPGTSTDIAQSFGPKASTLESGPVAADEDLWLTIGTTTIASGVKFTVRMEIAAL